jgi:putative phosphonate metabolism protein
MADLLSLGGRSRKRHGPQAGPAGVTAGNGGLGMRRYGIYWAPPAGSALWSFGSAWLGWDAEAGAARDPGPLPRLPLPWDAIVATPRRYGFHATLKPPFRLVAWRSADRLETALAAFARAEPPFALPPLVPVVEQGFLSLRPRAPCAALDAFAARTVEAFDAFRAPPDETEIARRRKAGLTPAQEALLARWGYPYVMEEFRFHLTLTGNLGDAAAAAVRDAIADRLAPHCRDPVPVHEVCLFGEPEAGHFRLIRRWPLTG